MGVIKRGTALIRTLAGNTLSTGQSILAGIQAAGDIERARAGLEDARSQLRLGNVAQCERMLVDAGQRFSQLAGAPEGTLRLADAVVLTLRGMCERLRQSPDEGREQFARAAELFASLPDDELRARDHGDFGMALTARTQYKGARPHLETAIAVEGAPPEHARELARVYLEAGKPTKAEPLIEQALLALPADPDLHLLRAMAQRARGKPGAAGSFVYAGELLLGAGRARDALYAFGQAEELGEGAAIGLRAEALRRLGREREALDAFDAAIAASKNPGAWLVIRRAVTRMALDDRDGAAEDAERALVLEPEGTDVLVLAGKVRLEQRDYEAAIELAARALAAEPGNWEAVMLAAQARLGRGDADGALTVVRSTGVDVLRHPELLTLHADLALAAGLPEEAIDRLERLQASPRADGHDAARYATVLAGNGRLDFAWLVTTRGLAVWPDDLDLRVAEARLLLARGNREAGQAKALELATQAPRSAAAQLLEAAALLAADPPWDEQTRAGALAAAERAAELDPGLAEPWWIRAQVLRQGEDPSGARAALAEVFDRDPHHHEARRFAVHLEVQSGDLERAEELARALAAEPPDDIDDMVLLAQVLAGRRKYGEALSLLRDPRVDSSGEPQDRADRLLSRAWVLIEMWQLTDAAKDLAAASELDRDRADIWTYRAAVARQLGDAKSASEYAQEALLHAPGDFAARTELAAAYLTQDDFGQAERLLAELEAERPDDIRVGLLHVQAVAASSPEEARTELAQLADANPDDTSVVYARARFELDVGDYLAALSLLEFIPEDDWRLNFLALRAEAYRLLAQPDKAIRDARSCLELAPEHEDALATLGLTLLGTGQRLEAVEVLERANAAYPDSPLVQARLGQGYAAVDRYGDALRALDAAAVAAAGNAWVIARLAEAVSEVGCFDASADLYRRAVSLDEGNASSWNGFGWSLENQDPPQLDQAEKAYRRAVELDRDPWFQQNLANVLFSRGDRLQAAEIYDKVLKEALRRRSEHIDFLSLAGWCAYRLGDLGTAARSLYEVTSVHQRIEGDHFDLALVHACDERISRAVDLYMSIIPLQERDEQRRRGLLLIARADLSQARDEHPHLAGSPEIDGVLSLMTQTIAALPAPPEIRARRRALS
jgi:tetratricopeptide (TPR) repeat protein